MDGTAHIIRHFSQTRQIRRRHSWGPKPELGGAFNTAHCNNDVQYKRSMYCKLRRHANAWVVLALRQSLYYSSTKVPPKTDAAMPLKPGWYSITLYT